MGDARGGHWLVNLPLHHEVHKFSSGTGSPGWSRKKGHKMVVVWWWLLTYLRPRDHHMGLETATTGTVVESNTYKTNLHLRLAFWYVEYEQIWQECGLLSACLAMCIRNSGSSLKEFPHLWQMYGRMPRWILLMCLSRPLPTTKNTVPTTTTITTTTISTAITTTRV